MKHALRSLARTPAFTLVALLTLALGIGVSTALFSVVHALLLAPLRYADAAQLVTLQSRHAEQGVSGLAPATFLDLAAADTGFAALAGQRYDYVNVTGTGTPLRVVGVQGTADYFNVFGVAPQLGRTWHPAETRAGAAPVVVLAAPLWQRQFASRADALGQTILLDDVAHTIIGIMPASFKEPWGNAELWRPIAMDGEEPRIRTSRMWGAFARIAPATTLEALNIRLATVASALARTHPEHLRGWTLQATSLQQQVVGDFRGGLLVALAAVGCVMLIACANVAGLSIVRATVRRKEFAIRAAVGASRAQLARLLLAESLLLSLTAGALGVLLGSWGLDALLATMPEGLLPRADEIALSGPVLAGTLVLALLTGIGFGLAPAFTASRVAAGQVLQEGAHGSSGGPAALRLRSALVVTEIALALLLLVGAGLLARSFASLAARKSGVDGAQVLSLTLSLSAKRYDTSAKRLAFYQRAESAVAALPGVQSAGFTQTSPFRWGIPFTFLPLGASRVFENSLPAAFYDSVSPDYFQAAGVPLLAGRTFTAADNATSKPVFILSESTARRYFGHENALGRELTTLAQRATFRGEIVGIVGDVRRSGLSQEAPLQVYRALAQRPTEFATLMVRTSLAPSSLGRGVQQAIWRIDPDMPISSVAPLDRLVGASVAQPRLHLTLFGIFAALALLLATTGLYGLVAYVVAQRSREFGIRLALGATPRDVLALVLRQSIVLALLGVSLGLVLAFFGARALRSLMFDVSVHDPLVYAGVAALLVTVAVLACWLPARRATKTDPMIALRSE